MRIVVAGGGTAGWMAAAALAHTMGETIELTLVESDSIGTVGVGEATIPPLILFNRLLGLNEAEFMRETQATFKLGIEFENWRRDGEKYLHAFGTTGRDHWSAGFQHFWAEGCERGYAEGYGDYCREFVAAYAGKFTHLPKNGLSYAYHLNATAYAAFLRDLAEKAGTKRVEGKIAQVQLDCDSGNIAALSLEDGQKLEGDLFIDCTGFRAMLIEGALHVGYDDWSHYLPCDRAIAVQTELSGPPVPYTRAIAHDAGWQWRIPLQHRGGNGIVYCSRYLSREAAQERLMSTLEGKPISEPRAIPFTAGVRRKQWHRNCVAIGLASGFLEPLESTSIHLIQRAVVRLIRMMPAGRISERDIAEFNDQQLTDMIQVRDFLILHYKATDRRDSAFWRQCAAMEIPDTLRQKIELFRETGRVFQKNNEIFAENSWVQVLLGQGIYPRNHHPITKKMSDAELSRFLFSLREDVIRTVATFPAHEDYVRQFCRAEEAAAA